MIKKTAIGGKKLPDSRPSYVEVNYSAEAMRLLYEAMGQRMPKPSAPRQPVAAADAKAADS